MDFMDNSSFYNEIYDKMAIPKNNFKKWDMRFLDLAEHISTWSKDPSTKIGAVVVDPKTKRVLSMGYNGFPRGINDSINRLDDRELKYSLVVHAEMNAIYNATLNGVSLDNSTIYVHGLPVCSDCAKGIIQVGINRVVYKSIRDDATWNESFDKSRQMFQEVGIEITVY